MNATEFIVKLKADGSTNDWLDLNDAHKHYQTISAKLPSADRGPFAVNVLCTLCRNIEKVPSWPSAVDVRHLLTLAIESMRFTRGQDNGHRARALVCAFHLQRYVVRQTTQKIPPELIIKLSYMPFENTAESLIKEHYKTYWNLLADRFTYIEKLKAQNMAITKLFTKLLDDILKVIAIYETVSFCNTVLVFLIKKLHSIYSECHGKELNSMFGQIFQSLSIKADVSNFKSLNATQSLDLYAEFNECFYIIAENSLKNDFEDSVLSDVVRSCATMLGHNPEIWHCLHMFYLNGFCLILTGNTDGYVTQNILTNIHISCENAAKLGYTKSLYATYPFLNQFLHIYINYLVSNSQKLWKKHFNVQVQETCLKIMILLIKHLKNCKQQIRCENCKIRTAQHDALRLCFQVKHFLSISIQENIDVTPLLPSLTSIVVEQYSILNQLCALGCNSYDKYYKRLQAEVHNSAIILYKASHYEYSLKLFDLYLIREIKHFKTESELKNISRALYNKGICELDYKLYENALKDAYLSLIFAHPESLKSDKYMSLVMDIKAKALKCQNDNESDSKSQNSVTSDNQTENNVRNDNKSQNAVENDSNLQITEKKDNKSKVKSDEYSKSTYDSHKKLQSTVKSDKICGTKDTNPKNSDEIDSQKMEFLQLMTILDACQICVDTNYYGNLKPFFCSLKFSTLLRHEFSMYAKLWPATAPIAGVWKAMLKLHYEEVAWIKAKDETIQEALFMTILETANTVRTIHHDQMALVVKRLVADFTTRQCQTIDMKLARATLLFIKAEYDLHEASEKYGWKTTEVNKDEESQPNRTVAQEFEAVASAVCAVNVWMEVGRCVDTVPLTPLARLCLQCAALSVSLLLRHNKMAEGLSLAHVGCALAARMDDKPTYVRLASTIIGHASSPSPQMESIISKARVLGSDLVESRDTVDVALGFLCELAMYYCKSGRVAVSAGLIQQCQAFTLDAYDKHPDVKLDIPLGRLVEAQSLLFAHKECAVTSQSMLSAVNCAQRHYVATGTSGTTWSTRRFVTLTVRHLATNAGIVACSRAKAALLLRRARSAAAAGQVNANAVALAKLSALTANTHCTDETQVKIDNRLKYILGIPLNDELHIQSTATNKEPMFTPKLDIETMLESMTFRQNQLSPSLPSRIPHFKIPDFLTHDRLCQCHSCQSPVTFILTCETVGLEASMYFRAKQFDIAKNYFEGCMKCFPLAESKINGVLKSYRDSYESYIVDMVEKTLCDDLRHVQLQVLIENAFFELSQRNDKGTDEKIVAIHEILNDYKDVDVYLKNDVINLLAATAKLRKPIKVPQICLNELEAEMDQLKLSPQPPSLMKPPKTPEIKPQNPPIIPKIMVSDEELPNMNLKVIKLDFYADENDKDKTETNKRSSKRTIKVPSPKLSKPELEAMTPMPKTSKKSVKTRSLDENTDMNHDFATPRPKGGHKLNNTVKDLNVEHLEFATPMPKTKRTLTKSKAIEINENDSVLDNATAKTDNTSVLDFATPKPRAERRNLTRSKAVQEKNHLFMEKNNTVDINDSDLEKTSYVTPSTNTMSDNFFTPLKTPADQYFTPMNSVKTYKKKSLRLGVAQNMENALCTPKIVITDDSNLDTNESHVTVPSNAKPKSKKVETGSIKALKDKRSLKRATSPGKLEKCEKKPVAKPERVTRLRKPVRFSIDSVEDSE